MTRLGYSAAQIEHVGRDAYNYQVVCRTPPLENVLSVAVLPPPLSRCPSTVLSPSFAAFHRGSTAQGVGNPHRLARLAPGEAVVDLGSGLGVDSLIAAESVGPAGSVVGVDLSRAEVAHSSARAADRAVPNLRYVVGDIEALPLPDSSVDVVISNGAFCLAPDKRKAFSEIHRVLKPGGRFAVATSTAKMRLDAAGEGTSVWPVCMRTFIHIDELDPLLNGLGFEHVALDTSDSCMQFELPGFTDDDDEAAEAAARAESSGRNQVHVGSPEFEHLAELDMNAICARVVVTGRKPALQAAGAPA